MQQLFFTHIHCLDCWSHCLLSAPVRAYSFTQREIPCLGKRAELIQVVYI